MNKLEKTVFWITTLSITPAFSALLAFIYEAELSNSFAILTGLSFALLGGAALYLMQEGRDIGFKLCLAFYFLQIIIIESSLGTFIGYFGYVILLKWNMHFFTLNLNVFALFMFLVTSESIRRKVAPYQD